MSADNIICIQRRRDGRYWVWMDFASNDYLSPNRDANAHGFYHLMEAFEYAFKYVDDVGYVEYGVQRLPDQPGSNGSWFVRFLRWMAVYRRILMNPQLPDRLTTFLLLAQKGDVRVQMEYDTGRYFDHRTQKVEQGKRVGRSA